MASEAMFIASETMRLWVLLLAYSYSAAALVVSASRVSSSARSR